MIVTQQKVIANPPSFVKIAKKYQRRSGTPALSNLSNQSSMSNGISAAAGTQSRAESPEISSSNVSVPGSTVSGGSIGLADFMNPEVLKTAKLWRFQKLSKAELIGLVEHYTEVSPSSSATKGQLIKDLMDHAASNAQ